MALRFAPRVVALKDGRMEHDGPGRDISQRELEVFYADAPDRTLD